jgi:hypothetical protein
MKIKSMAGRKTYCLLAHKNESGQALLLASLLLYAV